MSRRNRPPNRWGCKPEEDVCVEHDEPLWCPHGCEQVKKHSCKEIREHAWRDGVSVEEIWARIPKETR